MLYAQEHMAVIPAPLYAYFVNESGLTKRPWTPRMLEAWVAYEEQIAFFQAHGRQDLVNFRYRGYLENAMVNYQAARKAAQTPEVRRAIRRMDRQIPRLLRRMWKAGCIEFWIDFDILLYFRPVWARVQRFGQLPLPGVFGKRHGQLPGGPEGGADAGGSPGHSPDGPAYSQAAATDVEGRVHRILDRF